MAVCRRTGLERPVDLADRYPSGRSHGCLTAYDSGYRLQVIRCLTASAWSEFPEPLEELQELDGYGLLENTHEAFRTEGSTEATIGLAVLRDLRHIDPGRRWRLIEANLKGRRRAWLECDGWLFVPTLSRDERVHFVCYPQGVIGNWPEVRVVHMTTPATVWRATEDDLWWPALESPSE